MTERHPLVVRATEDGYVDTTHWVPDGPVELDRRDETLTQTLLSRATVGATDMLFAVARVLPGMHHIRHHHPYGSEIYYVIKGSCTVFLGDEEITVGPGAAVYIPPNCVHGARNDTDEVCEMAVVCSKPEYASLGLVYDE
ncbi:hypothetical protein GCM10010377_54820 [Streptomyces viridiviolaceus]|uniref:Cupin domain-containing protein n=1 Tax=Streptomyces viridiviolaceus TaxID=68282 RepID=A0ABW2E2X7_9ACTN|nr:cupin domain-containing protein [Streptomyces viridiviolaceus]GHB56820.1 hypothetical protein GCM10010377_54820 [Streptomyces viridiviolaceus]